MRGEECCIEGCVGGLVMAGQTGEDDAFMSFLWRVLVYWRADCQHTREYNQGIAVIVARVRFFLIGMFGMVQSTEVKL